jgi:hypothetical protein
LRTSSKKQFEKLEYTEEGYEEELKFIEKAGNFIHLLAALL